MKRILLVFAALLMFAGNLDARDDDVKGVQFGIAYRFDVYRPHSQQSSANISLGYRLNRGNYVGLQSGLAFAGSAKDDAGIQHLYRGIPILADYIHYFPIGDKERHSIYAGAEAGWIYRIFYQDNAQSQKPSVFPPFVCIKGGLDLSIVGLTHMMVGLEFNWVGMGATVGFTF